MTNSFLPEWAPIKSVLLVWPIPSGDWRNNYNQVVDCYWGILQTLIKAAPVDLLYHPSLDKDLFVEEIKRRALDLECINVLSTIPYDDTWVRDYGPLSLAQSYLSYTFNGWGGKYRADNDNKVPLYLTEVLGQTVDKKAFVCEGGGLETNGEVLLVNAECLVDELRNPNMTQAQVEQQLLSDLGMKAVLWLHGICLSGDDTDGHIDTIVRFSARNKLVFAGRNALHPDADVLQSLYQQVQALANENGWQTYELPSPSYRSLIDGRALPCTYANFLIVNQFVLAPIYGLAEDSAAIDTLKMAFRGYQVLPVRCEALLEQHGSLHCATMQIADINVKV